MASHSSRDVDDDQNDTFGGEKLPLMLIFAVFMWKTFICLLFDHKNNS